VAYFFGPPCSVWRRTCEPPAWLTLCSL